MNDLSLQRRALEIFDLALEQPDAERERFVLQSCGDETFLLAQVRSLLAASENVGDDEFTGLAVTAQSLALIPQPGDRVDDFEILEVLGQGGMGHVLRAQRTRSGYTQQVAIKFVAAQILNAHTRHRFEAERAVLARLQHPYIARLIDGGTTADGVPYLAMELVEGQRIDEFCDQHKLGVHSRLELVERVAQAVVYAHNHLVVHRDLKPANVLITADGLPKLVDFGVAKLIGVSTPEQVGSVEGSGTSTNVFGPHAFTPDYASPEQILDGDITLASDVYSLGILTYELLTGSRPYNFSELSYAEYAQTITSREMTQASEQLRGDPNSQSVAAQRSLTPSKLARTLSGDLDRILEKATHRDVAQRYSSAAAFAADLTNFREGRVVSAQGDSLLYRSGTLIRRYKLASAAVGLALLSLIVGFVGVSWQARIAEQRFDDLHEFVGVVIGDIYDSVADLQGATEARDRITSQVQLYLNRLAVDAEDNADLTEDLVLAHKRIADVQGLPTKANLGRTNDALANYDKALSISESLDSDRPGLKRLRALIYEKRADVLMWQGEVELALESSARSHSLFAELAVGGDRRAQFSLGVSHLKVGDLSGHPTQPSAGDRQAAQEAYQESLAVIEALALSEGASFRERRYHNLVLERLGLLHLRAQDLPLAQRYFEQSMRSRERLWRDFPDDSETYRDLAVAVEMLADTKLANGDVAGALPMYQEALGIYRELAESEPRNASAQRTLAIGLENLALGQLQAEQVEAPRQNLIEALAIAKRLTAVDPKNQRFKGDFARLTETLQELNQSSVANGN